MNALTGALRPLAGVSRRRRNHALVGGTQIDGILGVEGCDLHLLRDGIEAEVEAADVTAIPGVWGRENVSQIVPDLTAARRAAPKHTDPCWLDCQPYRSEEH